MLVSGLVNEALSKMISSSQGDFSDVHQSLCDCARSLVDKYEEKQKTPENRHKLEVKTRAVTILLEELGKVPKEAGVTREALSSALECHVAALQDHEHLLSEKGNNYQLVKQTQGLRGQAEAIASLLRYHQLKNKVLGPCSPLSDEQKECVSELHEKKCLRLKMLENLEKDPAFLTPDIIILCRKVNELPASRVIEPTCPHVVETVLQQLKIKAVKQIRTGMEQINAYTEQKITVLEQLETKTVLELKQLGITMEQLRTKITMELLKIKIALEQLESVLEQIKAHEQGLLKPDVCDEVVKHEKPAPDNF